VKECIGTPDKPKLFRATKSILKTDALKKLERQILSSIPSLSCANCGGQSPKLRQENQTKVFEKPLSAKQRSLMDARGKVYEPLVFQPMEPLSSSKKKQSALEDDMDDAKSDISSASKKETMERFTARATTSRWNSSDVYLTPLQVRAHVQMLWSNHQSFFDNLYGSTDPKTGQRVSSPEVFFLSVVPVTPNRFRPLSKMGDMTYEHPQNAHLTQILKANELMASLKEQEKRQLASLDPVSDPKLYENTKSEFFLKMVEAWIQLQIGVNSLIDTSKSAPVGGKPPPPGIRQVLEKKEGLFRKHMMGKRVNYAARSVISPDPYIETSEIGIPPVFATKLTYPEPVTHHNVANLRQNVINGPTKWPGASHIQQEDGSLINLASFDEAGRTALANQLLTPSMASGSQGQVQQSHVNKKVYRHLKNGDFLLLNRQPTLHKPSIMAHTARILPGEKTIRMHYANCNTYNADFDGDEMNIHFPQNEVARAEAMLIARTDLQYLVPTDGGVLRGLIQDHVDAGVDMSSRDTFLDRETYMQLVFTALRPDGAISQGLGNGNIEKEVVIGRNGRIVTVPPALIKPRPMWTGKQVITTVMINLIPENRDLLNLKSKAKIPAKAWGPSAPEEQEVLFMDGQFLIGVLDKSQFGASAHGLVHAVYEVYGPPFAGKLLSILGRLFTSYLQFAGFTCRMDDLILTPEGDKIRRDLIDSSKTLGHQVAVEVTELPATIKPDSKEADAVIRAKMEECLREDEKMAHLDSCMKSKTNRITSKIISTCIPDHLYKPFPQNNMQVMTVSGAKGSSVNVSQISCLLGQQELEGRRVPTMVSGKTLPSFQAFDTSARSGGFITGRFLTGIKPQEYFYHCMAGREGLIDTAVKTSRSGYLQRCLIKHLEGLRVHYDQTVRDVDGSILQFHYGEDSLDVIKQKSLDKFDFCAMNYMALLQRYNPQKAGGKVNEDAAVEYLEKTEDKEDADPVLSLYNPAKYMGSVSDKFAEKLEKYMKSNPSSFLQTKEHKKGLKKASWSNLVKP
jgi:DNA-directed RNA polymerase I subunit RPA1